VQSRRLYISDISNSSTDFSLRKVAAFLNDDSTFVLNDDFRESKTQNQRAEIHPFRKLSVEKCSAVAIQYPPNFPELVRAHPLSSQGCFQTASTPVGNETAELNELDLGYLDPDVPEDCKPGKLLLEDIHLFDGKHDRNQKLGSDKKHQTTLGYNCNNEGLNLQSHFVLLGCIARANSVHPHDKEEPSKVSDPSHIHNHSQLREDKRGQNEMEVLEIPQQKDAGNLQKKSHSMPTTQFARTNERSVDTDLHRFSIL
jgi:hypothetical protein